MGMAFPTELTNDKLFDRVLAQQFQVTIIRLYRNQPGMVRWWAPTLTTVEGKIQQMLDVLAARNWSDAQKSTALDRIEADIGATYEAFFLRWAQLENAGDWQFEYKTMAAYGVEIVTEPPGAVVHYIMAGSWDLYQLGRRNGKNVPKPAWEQASGNSVTLIGKYYFHAQFENSQTKVIGPILINRGRSLVFTPRGLR
ncbi:MAG: hypothetical protein DWQ37_05405 [Planctomycetota bacterium]|nr:MAG: hypothetical protein DWQ37_05405 [Planctomycetota bacterium]